MSKPETIAGKPVIWTPRGKVLNPESGFREKQLCTGPTFTTGLACVYSCAYCYVDAQMVSHPKVLEAKASLGKSFQEIVIRRQDAINSLHNALVDEKGKPRYTEPGVIYASPLVDVAANVALAKETAEACKLILKHTPWDIRLLSKSNLLPYLASLIPEQYKQRMIFGVSTGTLEDDLGLSFEEGTAKVSKRIASIHKLQDDGWRTFGMICPSLPQKDYQAFSQSMVDALRIDRMEHVWAEVLNVRGESMERTCSKLRSNGFDSQADAIREVGSDTVAWEQYARDTFLAHTKTIPPEKLRFLQYVTPESQAWWASHAAQGALLLGPHAAISAAHTGPAI